MANSKQIAAGVLFSSSYLLMAVFLGLLFYVFLVSARWRRRVINWNYLIDVTGGAVSTDFISAMTGINFRIKEDAWNYLAALTPLKEPKKLQEKVKGDTGEEINKSVRVTGDKYDPVYVTAVNLQQSDYFEEESNFIKRSNAVLFGW